MLRIVCLTVFGLIASALACNGPALAQRGGRSVLLVLDASGSMKQLMPDGRSRLENAKLAAEEVLGKLPTGTRIGLRVYGHQHKVADKNCEDTALMMPLGPAEANRAALSVGLANVRASGYTPISLSLERAASDLSAEPDHERVVVLLSDGKETCKSDPCNAARALAAANVSLVVHTIGLGVDAAARSQLQCIASVVRGTYSDADTSRELIERLGQAVIAKPIKPPPRPPAATVGYLQVKGIIEAGVPVLDAKGDIVGPVGAVQQKLDLSPGIYSVRFANGLWTGIEIKAGEVTEIVPAYLKIETPAKDNLYLLDGETDEEVGSFFMESAPVTAVMPGRYSARTSLPFAWANIELVAGATTVLKPALARIVHIRSPGVYSTYRVTKMTSGIAAEVVSGSDMSLPPGRYLIEDPDRAGLAVEVELDAGDIREITLER